MENESTRSSLFDLSFNDLTQQALARLARIAGVAAVLSLIVAIASILGSVVQLLRPARVRLEEFGEVYKGSDDKWSELAGSVLTLILFVVLFYYLKRFSDRAKKALNTNDQGSLNEGLSSLATYFKIIGVLLIIGIVFAFAALLFTL